MPACIRVLILKVMCFVDYNPVLWGEDFIHPFSNTETWSPFKKIYYSSLAVLSLRCCMGFSLVAGSREYSSCSAQASQRDGFSCCGAQALGHVGSVAVAPGSTAQAQ